MDNHGHRHRQSRSRTASGMSLSKLLPSSPLVDHTVPAAEQQDIICTFHAVAKTGVAEST